MTIPATRTIWSRLADVAGLVATPLGPSHYLQLINPLWATHRLTARVEAVRAETPDARTLTLRPGRSFAGHRAGQYLSVGAVVDGRQVSRTYSISSPPERDDGCITITVKAVAGGRLSTYLVREVRPGAYLSLGRAEGDFVLPEPTPERLLFITAGSGITPIASMLRSLAHRREMGDVVHLHYAPSRPEVIFGDELERLARRHASYRLAMLYPGDGLFSAAQLAARCRDWQEREAWACGPPPLLDAVTARYAPCGLDGRLHLERFTAARAARASDATGGRLRLHKSGVTAVADGATPLLEVAERAGLSPLHGCRIGVCHSCDATLLSGCVRDLRTGQRLDEPSSRVQLCVSAAAGDVEIDL